MNNIDNVFHVPKKQWSKWNDLEARMFNYINDTMLNNPNLFLHPHAGKPHPEVWKTTAWNAAWFTADGLKEIRKNG